MANHFPRLTLSLISLFFVLAVSLTNAAPRSWQGISSDVNWSNAINWTPIGNIVSSDNILIGNQPNATGDATIIDQDFTIATLAISNGASADTADNRLDVSGDILISGAGSKFISTGGLVGFALEGDDLTLLGGGAVEMANGIIRLDGTFNINTGTELRGYGTIFADRYFNDGAITGTSSTTPLSLHSLAFGTNLIDLDGTLDAGTVSAVSGTVDIAGPLADPFDSVITVGANHSVRFVSAPVTISSSGVVHLQGSASQQARFGNYSNSMVVNVAGTLNASLQTEVSQVRFMNSAVITLTNAADVLEIRGDESRIEAGANFVGSGQINLPGTTLTLADGAIVGVPINFIGGSGSGELVIGDFIGSAQVLSVDFHPLNGTLKIDLGGSSFNQYDRLTVLNSANLDNELEVSLVSGFVPRGGQSFQIISSLGLAITGQFDTVANDLPALTGDLSWEIDYSNTDLVVLRVHTPYSADFDGDGDVDHVDLTDPVDGWQARYGSDLDGADFLAWQRQFGSGVPSIAVSREIPEPATFMILLFAASFAASRLPSRTWRKRCTFAPPLHSH